MSPEKSTVRGRPRGSTNSLVQERNREIYKSWVDGMTIKEISEKYLVSPAYAADIIRKFPNRIARPSVGRRPGIRSVIGLPSEIVVPWVKPDYQERNLKIFERLLAGEKIDALAREVEMSPTGVRGILYGLIKDPARREQWNQFRERKKQLRIEREAAGLTNPRWGATTRQLEIFEKRLSGLTLDEIGKEYGVSRERIRQICEKVMLRDWSKRAAWEQALAENEKAKHEPTPYTKAKRELRDLFKTGLFPRERVLEILEDLDVPLEDQETDESLCRWIHEWMAIANFGAYAWCAVCKSPCAFPSGFPKLKASIRTSRCSACNRKAAYERYHRLGYKKISETVSKEKMAVYGARWMARKTGKPLPPLPPKGPWKGPKPKFTGLWDRGLSPKKGFQPGNYYGKPRKPDANLES